jgi:hypothetical protein
MSYLLLVSIVILLLNACSTNHITDSQHQAFRTWPNPFFTENDRFRVTKESFRIYIDSISRSQFDIVVSASDVIAMTLEEASGWRKPPAASLRVAQAVVIIPESVEFKARFGALKRPLVSKKTEFLSISDSQIVTRVVYFSLETRPSIEVLDVYIFKRDKNGWYFDDYDRNDAAYPCARVKIWRGPNSECLKFER